MNYTTYNAITNSSAGNLCDHHEISFTRHFYKPVPMRTLDEIKADIFTLGQETEGLLENILKSEGG